MPDKLDLTADEISALIAACQDITDIFGDPDTDGAAPLELAPSHVAERWPHMLSAKAKLIALT